jgi:hypothetical protein
MFLAYSYCFYFSLFNLLKALIYILKALVQVFYIMPVRGQYNSCSVFVGSIWLLGFVSSIFKFEDECVGY